MVSITSHEEYKSITNAPFGSLRKRVWYPKWYQKEHKAIEHLDETGGTKSIRIH